MECVRDLLWLKRLLGINLPDDALMKGRGDHLAKPLMDLSVGDAFL